MLDSSINSSMIHSHMLLESRGNIQSERKADLKKFSRRALVKQKWPEGYEEIDNLVFYEAFKKFKEIFMLKSNKFYYI